MSKIKYYGVGYDPIVVTDYWSGTQADRVVWTPKNYVDAHIHAINVSMTGPGIVQFHSSAGDPITNRIALPSGSHMIDLGAGELYVAPSGIAIYADSIDCQAEVSVAIYAHEGFKER